MSTTRANSLHSHGLTKFQSEYKLPSFGVKQDAFGYWRSVPLYKQANNAFYQQENQEYYDKALTQNMSVSDNSFLQ